MIETARGVAPKFAAADHTEPLAGRVAEVLRKSGYAPLRKIVVEHHGGIVVLRGRVPTFYQKQLAQALVSKVRGVGSLVNHLCVDGTL